MDGAWRLDGMKRRLNIFTSPILLITLAALPLDWTQRWAGLWITVGLIKAII